MMRLLSWVVQRLGESILPGLRGAGCFFVGLFFERCNLGLENINYFIRQLERMRISHCADGGDDGNCEQGCTNRPREEFGHRVLH